MSDVRLSNSLGTMLNTLPVAFGFSTASAFAHNARNRLSPGMKSLAEWSC
jgi:hypothetical protein